MARRCKIDPAERMAASKWYYGTLWLLTQGETRETKRVRSFTEFVSHSLAAYAQLLASPSCSRDRRVADRRL